MFNEAVPHARFSNRRQAGTVLAALTGRTAGPPLFDCLLILGRSKAVDRLRAAAHFAESSAGAP